MGHWGMLKICWSLAKLAFETFRLSRIVMMEGRDYTLTPVLRKLTKTMNRHENFFNLYLY